MSQLPQWHRLVLSHDDSPALSLRWACLPAQLVSNSLHHRASPWLQWLFWLLMRRNGWIKSSGICNAVSLPKSWLAQPSQPREPEPPVARCLPAHAEPAATQGTGLLQSCLVLAGLWGGNTGCCAESVSGAVSLARPWGCQEQFCSSLFPQSWQRQGWGVSPSVSNSARIFALERSQSWDLFGRENTALVKGREVQAVGCTCGQRACLHLHWLPWFAALKQTSSLGTGAVRNVSGAQGMRRQQRWS